MLSNMTGAMWVRAKRRWLIHSKGIRLTASLMEARHLLHDLTSFTLGNDEMTQHCDAAMRGLTEAQLETNYLFGAIRRKEIAGGAPSHKERAR